MDTNSNIPESEIKLKPKAYKLRCLDCERARSRKGNNMLVQTFEIIDEPPYTQDGETIDINGVKIMNWAVLTDTSIGVVNAQRASFGLPKVDKQGLDNINPLDYKGAEGYAYCESQSEEMKNDVTGEFIMNPYDNKPEVTWTKRIIRYPSKRN